MAGGSIELGEKIYKEIRNLTVGQIKERIACSSIDELEYLIEAVRSDTRKGVKDLEARIQNMLKSQYKKAQKKNVLLKQERILWDMGYQMVGGIDEAGRGPLAGPIVAACVIFPKDVYIEGVDDSKKLTPVLREKLYDEILDKAVSVGIGRVSWERIDEINILNATREAMEEAVLNCSQKQVPEFLLIDAMEINVSLPCLSIVKGDQNSHSIAAASIIAKVTRDREMLKWHEKYPDYRFDRHKGYGTAAHIDAIRKLGLCPIHRRSFVKDFI